MALFIALVETVILASVLALPILLLKFLGLPPEVPLFYGVAAFAVAGVFAGRSGTFPVAALAVSFVGGFAAYATFASLATPPLNFAYAAIHGAVAGFAAWSSGKWRMAKVTPEVALENAEKRQCRMCGARVGSKARRCWRCRASLNRIT